MAERPGAVGASQGDALDAALLRNGARYEVPTAEELRNMSPGMRRLILEYFELLNRAAAANRGGERR